MLGTAGSVRGRFCEFFVKVSDAGNDSSDVQQLADSVAIRGTSGADRGLRLRRIETATVSSVSQEERAW